jgi:hypothetical protein
VSAFEVPLKQQTMTNSEGVTTLGSAWLFARLSAADAFPEKSFKAEGQVYKN